MTDTQLNHYIKGGIFLAVYRPKTLDISPLSKTRRGKILRCSCNVLVAPLISPEQFAEQHAFDVESIVGWVPEEDLKDLVIIDEFKSPVTLPKYLYKMTYIDESKMYHNFGKGQWKVPCSVGREYNYESDEHVMKLSNPQADKIEKAVWNGEQSRDIKWETLYIEQ